MTQLQSGGGWVGGKAFGALILKEEIVLILYKLINEIPDEGMFTYSF